MPREFDDDPYSECLDRIDEALRFADLQDNLMNETEYLHLHRISKCVRQAVPDFDWGEVFTNE